MQALGGCVSSGRAYTGKGLQGTRAAKQGLELVINLKSANALGLSTLPSLLVRAGSD